MAEVKVRYNNSDIAAILKPGGMTLLTAGKYMGDNVEVLYTDPNPNVIQDQDGYVVLSDLAGIIPIGGLANMTDINDPEYSPAFMLSEMKNGNTAGGKITVGALPNTESLLIETGLQQVHGFILTAPTYDMASSTSGTSAKHIIAFGRNFSGTITIFAVAQSILNLVGTANAYQNGAKLENSPINGYLRIDGGDIYYTARYNKNGNYQLIKNGVEYEWLAW